MFLNGAAGQRPPAMASSPHHPQSSQSPSDMGRSRQNSDAMDINAITDQNPPGREHAVSRWGDAASPRLAPFNNHRNPEKYALHEENGRTYHGYRKGIYLLPCDETEQDRLDIFHKLITVARVSDGLIYAPHPSNGRFLDLGCGTGIWGIDVAHKYPDAFVVGVDLAPIQPPNLPRNCDFYAPFDFEGPWAMGEDYWDLVHMQMGCGSVANWPSLYRRIHAHLRPGAWFEQVEIDFEPRCDDRSLDGLALRYWYQCLKEATEQTMRPLAHSSRETIRNLQEAGFTEIDHQMVGLPLNPWHQDEHERTVARWYNLAISESLEVFGLAAFTRVFGWPTERIQRLAAEVKSEAFNKKIRSYNILHIYQARKPVPN